MLHKPLQFIAECWRLNYNYKLDWTQINLAATAPNFAKFAQACYAFMMSEYCH